MKIFANFKKNLKFKNFFKRTSTNPESLKYNNVNNNEIISNDRFAAVENKNENEIAEKNINLEVENNNDNHLNKDLKIIEKDLKLEKINKKYEIYKDYERTELLTKDPDFGKVTTYNDFLDEGKSRFSNENTNLLTKYIKSNNALFKDTQNDLAFKELSLLVDEKYKQFYSNYKEEYKYNLKNHQERWYKEAIYSKKDENHDINIKLEDPLIKHSSSIRNFKEHSSNLEKNSLEPKIVDDIRIKIKTPFESLTDNFAFLNNITDKKTKQFLKKESLYTANMLFKYSHVNSQLLEDYKDIEGIGGKCWFQLSDKYFSYKKNFDDFSLFLVNADMLEPSLRGGLNLKKEDEENIKMYSKEIFGINDFIELNSKYNDLDFLKVAKNILDKLENGEEALISYSLCPKEQYLVLVFMLQDSSSKVYDIMVKDIKNDVLLPLVISNTNGIVSFDKFDGLFYTQLDITGRPSKIFRHQIGRARKHDSLVYNEKNDRFKISTYNCNSKDFIYIEIGTVKEPYVNEIWIKPTNDLNKVDFSCIKKFEHNVSYKVKQTNNTLFLLINKSDTSDKTLKQIKINDPKIQGLLEYSTIVKSDANKNDKSNIILKREENLNETNDIDNNNNNNLDILSKSLINKENSLVLTETDLIKVEDNINIIDFEVFKNYLVVLEEENFKRRFKIFNLLNFSNYIHEPIQPYFNITLIDNCGFNSKYFRYLNSNFTNPYYTTDYSLGTRKSYTVHANKYKGFNPDKYKTEIFYVTNRDNSNSIPVVLSYKEELYTEESPFIIHTKGAQSEKADLDFNDLLIPLLDRGFVYAVPMLRGTKFSNFDWFEQGTADNKINHFTDFIDIACYLKDNMNVKKVILYGEGHSGSLTAAVSLTQNPELFHSCILHNGVYDVIEYCLNNNDASVLDEFGDISIKEFYDVIKLYSVYHLKFEGQLPPLLITADEDNKNLSNTLKFVAKLRKNNESLKIKNKVYFDLLSDKPSIEEKMAFLFSFAIGEAYLTSNNNK